ncbi:hypothetical protein VT03_01945 [Planctomyces sp. SH-PL14]|nr:hypothetical protein VT03_01945 [Planctomyces sp. SH-PL14]
MRPGVGEYVTVALFQAKRTLRCVDCTINVERARKGTRLWWEGMPMLPAEELEADAWKAIDRAFSVPLKRSDDTAEYAATQILAELFKQEGYDGLVFRSSVADGTNCVLFDLEAVAFATSRLWKVRDVQVGFDGPQF